MRHWQIERWRFAAWFGVTKRLMVGVVLNFEDGGNLGLGFGPFYIGVGLTR